MSEAFREGRSLGHYEVLGSPLQGHFSSRYVTVGPDELLSAHAQILRSRDRLWGVVPMAEWQPELEPVVHRAATYLSSLLHGSQTIFMDGGSCAENVAAARRGGATVISQDHILDAVDWNRLLPILNLDRRPHGRAGQGLNVLAGHIAMLALGVGSDDLIFQCDADVASYRQLTPLERLVCAWSRHEGLQHVKLAKFGRCNEGAMIVRALQQLWGALDLDWVPSAVKELGSEVFLALSPDKWLTCGLYLSRGQVIQARPAATGYLDAVMQAIWTVHAPECGWRGVRHVEAPDPCIDVADSHRKDFLMQTTISMFLQSVVLWGVPPHRWDLEDLQQINQRLMPALDNIPLIGDSDGPVSIERVRTERIIPSPRALLQHQLVDLDLAARVAQRAGVRRA